MLIASIWKSIFTRFEFDKLERSVQCCLGVYVWKEEKTKNDISLIGHGNGELTIFISYLQGNEKGGWCNAYLLVA